jgi:hypothetical protein
MFGYKALAIPQASTTEKGEVKLFWCVKGTYMHIYALYEPYTLLDVNNVQGFVNVS